MSNRSLNLIPAATRRRRMVRQAIRLWAKSTVFTGVGVALLLGTEWLRGVAILRELGEYEGRCVPLMKIATEAATIEKQVRQLTAREELTERLARDDRGIAVMAALSLATSGGEGDVYVESVSYNGGDRTVLRVEGAGIDGPAVAGFVERLEQTEVFWTVLLESSEPLGGEGVNLRRFELACEI